MVDPTFIWMNVTCHHEIQIQEFHLLKELLNKFPINLFETWQGEKQEGVKKWSSDESSYNKVPYYGMACHQWNNKHGIRDLIFGGFIETTKPAEAVIGWVKQQGPAKCWTAGTWQPQPTPACTEGSQCHGAAPHHRHGEGEEGQGSGGGDYWDEKTGKCIIKVRTWKVILRVKVWYCCWWWSLKRSVYSLQAPQSTELDSAAK